jgi:predicted cation transporter
MKYSAAVAALFAIGALGAALPPAAKPIETSAGYYLPL